jgi:hypothetical protein
MLDASKIVHACQLVPAFATWKLRFINQVVIIGEFDMEPVVNPIALIAHEDGMWQFSWWYRVVIKDLLDLSSVLRLKEGHDGFKGRIFHADAD